MEKMAMMAVAVLAFLISLPNVSSAVFSVDLGSEWMKVAVVDVKPGQAPIEIALNEMSKRKSPTLVAFSGGNRRLAEEASGISARYPERVYSRVRDMGGKTFDAVQQLANSSYLPFQLEELGGTVSIRTDDQQIYRTEELLAMVLGYCRGLAESHVKSPVKDAVITVPPFFGQAERKFVTAAAEAADINVLSLINEPAAAALQYGIDKDFSEESRYILFYDMGATSTYAAVFRFSSYTLKERGKNVSHNYFELKGIRWDAEIGGQAMEMRLVDYFAEKFERLTGIDVRKSPKAVAKLKKQAKRTKEILSANTEASIFVDSLLDEYDFNSQITRETFEEICSDIWERALVPLNQVLIDVNMSAQEMYAVELLGGGSRVPKLQQVLSDFLGKKNLERHLDADEAIALGAALHAANLTDGIKLNRKLGMVDGISYGIVMKVNTEEEEAHEVVVPRLKKIPSKFARAVKQQQDYELSLMYDPAGELPPGVTSPEISAYKITGMTDAMTKYGSGSHNLTAPVKSMIHFSVSRSGIVSVDRAEAVVEMMEWVEVVKKSNASEGLTNTTTTAAAAAEISNATEVKEEEGKKEGMGEEVEEVKEKKLRKKTVRVALKVAITRNVGSVGEETVAEMRDRLRKLQVADDEKRRTEEAKNNLESYVYSTKELLESLSDELDKVSTTAEQGTLFMELEETAEWVYSDGSESASSEEFKKRLEELKAIGDPMFKRLEQLQARPAAVEAAKRYVEEVEGVVKEWKSSKPWIDATEVGKEADGLISWLEEKESAQAAAGNFAQPPVFTSEDVYAKMEALRSLVSKKSKLPKPKPKPAAKTPTTTSTEGHTEGRTEGGTDANNSSNDDAAATSSHEEL